MTEPARSVARVPVHHGTGSYEVCVGVGLLDRLPELLAERAPAFRYALLADDRVAELLSARVLDACRGAGLTVDLFTFPAGEASKNRAEWSRLTDAMLAAGFGRDACVVALGGGVTGDLAGFVAATYLRGIPVVQVPTSLVAMIDSSVGGKTGVDVPRGKNLVGAFHPPRVVVVDPAVTSTLPRAERSQGLAEAVKHGAILDAAYFAELAADAPALLEGDVAATARAVRRSVELKAGVVSDDEREAGLRQVLNFGHTLGHALEAASDYRMGHGTAVAAGMVLEARLGERLGVTEAGTSGRLEDALACCGLDTAPALPPSGGRPLDYLGADKKARRGRPRYVLLRRVGAVAHENGWSRPVPDDLVSDVLAGAGRPG